VCPTLYCNGAGESRGKRKTENRRARKRGKLGVRLGRGLKRRGEERRGEERKELENKDWGKCVTR